MACACESLFPLPVEEKAVVGCLRFAFPLACRGKGLPRDSAGLRGWGAHGALQGPEGLRGALQCFRRHGISRDRPKLRFSSTGTRNMTFSIRVCALVMAFSSAYRGKGLLRSPPGASKAPSGFQGSEQVLNLSKSKCFSRLGLERQGSLLGIRASGPGGFRGPRA